MRILNGISVLIILAMVCKQYTYIRKKGVPPKFVLVTYKGYLLTIPFQHLFTNKNHNPTHLLICKLCRKC